MFAGSSKIKPKRHFSRYFMPVFTYYYLQNIGSGGWGCYSSPCPVSYPLYSSQSARSVTAPKLSFGLTNQYLTITQHNNILITHKLVIINNVWIAPGFHFIIA